MKDADACLDRTHTDSCQNCAPFVPGIVSCKEHTTGDQVEGMQDSNVAPSEQDKMLQRRKNPIQRAKQTAAPWSRELAGQHAGLTLYMIT